MPGKSGYLKSLKIIHLALLIGQCIMLAAVFYLVIRHAMPVVSEAADKTLQVIALLLVGSCVFFGWSAFRKKLSALSGRNATLSEKSNAYRMANIIQWAALEAGALFSISCFLLTGNYAFSALAIALIIFFALLAPSRLKLMLQLQMSEQEVDSLQ